MSDQIKSLREDVARNLPWNQKHVSTLLDKAEDAPSIIGWDAKPIVYIVSGKAKEFFTIGHLANALGRKPVTLRSWESKGVFPKSPYRSPAPRGSIPGKASKGKRLWTREQIEGVLRIALEEGVLLDGGPPPTQRFTARVNGLFITLYNSEHNEGIN